MKLKPSQILCYATIALLCLSGCSEDKNLTVDKVQAAFNKVNLGGGSVTVDGIRAGPSTGLAAARAPETLADIHFTNLNFGNGAPNQVYTGPAVAVFQGYTDGRWKLYEYVLTNGSGLRFRPVDVIVP